MLCGSGTCITCFGKSNITDFLAGTHVSSPWKPVHGEQRLRGCDTSIRACTTSNTILPGASSPYHHIRKLLVVTPLIIETAHDLLQISGWKFDGLDITIGQRHCEALYAAGRTKDAAEGLLKLVSISDEDTDSSRSSIAEWVSSELMSCLSVCRLFNDSPQISPTDISPLPTLTQPDMVTCRGFRSPSIQRPPLHS